MNPPVKTLAEQTKLMLAFLQSKAGGNMDDPSYTQVSEWMRTIPPSYRSEDLKQAFAAAFSTTAESAFVKRGSETRPAFDPLVPPSGWLRDYHTYTLQTEPPTVFHFFAGATAIGAALGRRTFFDMGAYKIYPNLCTVIVAPSGRCRKTSACNLGISLVRRVEAAHILADKLTPEALITSFEGKESAVGLIYAPELAVFLGKQKYQEGMVPLLTALFDCPDSWSSETIMRGQAKLENVAISFLACTTMDWLQTAIPKDAFGGGFMSRLLFVVQESTPRCFPRPPAPPPELRKTLCEALIKIQHLDGPWTMSEAAGNWFDSWYINLSDKKLDDKQFAGYMERKPSHMIRLAMILGAAEDTFPTLHTSHLERAEKILNWLELYLPSAFGQLQQSQTGEDQERLLSQLSKAGGTMSHSNLLRRNSYKMDSRAFKGVVDTLVEQGLVKKDGATGDYYLTSDGWQRV